MGAVIDSSGEYTEEEEDSLLAPSAFRDTPAVAAPGLPLSSSDEESSSSGDETIILDSNGDEEEGEDEEYGLWFDVVGTDDGLGLGAVGRGHWTRHAGR